MNPAHERSTSFSYRSVSVVFCSYHIGPSGTFKDDFGRSRGMLMEYLGDVYISQCNVLPVNLGQILHTLGTCETSCIFDHSLTCSEIFLFFSRTCDVRGIYICIRRISNRANRNRKVFVRDEISCWYARVRASS